MVATEPLATAWPEHLLTVQEWGELPDTPGHRVELCEGVLLMVPRPHPMHQRAAARIATLLDAQLPAELTALTEVDVVVDEGPPTTVRVPDVVVVSNALAEASLRFAASDVLVAVEIVSPGTARTDRVTKLAEYAEAGIALYWLVELGPPPRLTEHALGVDGRYTAVLPVTGRARLGNGLTLDLDELTRR